MTQLSWLNDLPAFPAPTRRRQAELASRLRQAEREARHLRQALEDAIRQADRTAADLADVRRERDGLERRLYRSGVRLEILEPVPLDRGPVARRKSVTRSL